MKFSLNAFLGLIYFHIYFLYISECQLIQELCLIWGFVLSLPVSVKSFWVALFHDNVPLWPHGLTCIFCAWSWYVLRLLVRVASAIPECVPSLPLSLQSHCWRSCASPLSSTEKQRGRTRSAIFPLDFLVTFFLPRVHHVHGKCARLMLTGAHL